MTTESVLLHGGDIVAEVLLQYGVQHLFTLAGGHISPIYIGCQSRNIEVIDVRHEANAVFAADAEARLTGSIGVAAVTAGPGVTNTITAMKNAQLAESPLLLIGGATAVMLRGKGALQDIDQLALMRPHVKFAARAKKVREIAPLLEKAIHTAMKGVPGPVFVELPVDILYPESVVRDLMLPSAKPRNLMQKAMKWYINRYLHNLFRDMPPAIHVTDLQQSTTYPSLDKLQTKLQLAERPVILVGSQAMQNPQLIPQMISVLEHLQIPVFLSSMARGLLGKNHPLHIRHGRTAALRSADFVLLLGVATDFRLDYGRQISGSAFLVSVNKNPTTLKLNRIFRKIQLPIHANPAVVLTKMLATPHPSSQWLQSLQEKNQQRKADILQQSNTLPEKYVNPLYLCNVLEEVIDDDSVLIGDGGDFVGTISYSVSPRQPLRWLDPGVFGTLGSGGGFALAAQLFHRQSEVWLFYGDGSAGYTITEFDTFVRHNLPVIAVIGNDASWAQIAREQVALFADDIATKLDYTAYNTIAEGFGAKGILVSTTEEVKPALLQAKKWAKTGHPVVVNVLLAASDFRKGSISM